MIASEIMPFPEPLPVRLMVTPLFLPRWFHFLESGFLLPAETGESVRNVLSRRVGLDPRYIEERIQTVFLNGKPVDDLDKALVGEGAVLALSAALPGLVGATMRRGGKYAPMREAIAHVSTGTNPGAGKPTLLRIKFFNLVAREQGPGLLARGVRVRGAELSAFVARHPEEIEKSTLLTEVAGKPAETIALAGSLPEVVLLSITAA